nr:hypothetical protein [Bacillus pumilus]
MSIITINGVAVDVDIREELEQYEWDRPTWHADRLTAASPFRDDRTPSFYVYYEDTETAKVEAISVTVARANAAASLSYSHSCVKKPRKRRLYI